MKQRRSWFLTFVLIGLFLVALIIRVYGIGRIPVGMTDDELREAYSAAALWETGKALAPGAVMPFLFVVNNFSFNPVPIYLSSPFVGLLGISMFTSRLSYSLAGFLALVGTYFLIRELTRDRRFAFAAAGCMAFNVWAIQLSRMAYEAVFAQMFYIWGTYAFLLFSRTQIVRILGVAMILFFLAFNSYDAMKLIYIPLLVLLCVFVWRDVKHKKACIGIVVGSILFTFLVFGYVYRIKNPTVRGSNFTIFQDTNRASESVELARRASDAPGILQRMYHNKAVYFTDAFLKQYTYAFSWDYLFFHQEASGIFSLRRRGNLYLVEIPLLFIGGLMLFAKKRRIFWISLSGLLIGALPSGIGPEPFTYATRASFMLPWFMLWVGAGIVYVIESFKKKWMGVFVILVAYVYFIGGYLTQYYFEWPKSSAADYSKGIEDLVSYMAPRTDQYPVMLVSNVNDTFLLHWALMTKVPVRSVQASYKDLSYQFAPVKILPSCLQTDGKDPRATLDEYTMYVANPSCHKQKPDHMIILPDGVNQWAIYVRPKKGTL